MPTPVPGPSSPLDLVTSAEEDIEWARGLHLDRAPLPVRRQAARDRIVAARLRVARTGDSCDYKALEALCTARLRITPGYYRDRHQAVVTLVNVLRDRQDRKSTRLNSSHRT